MRFRSESFTRESFGGNFRKEEAAAADDDGGLRKLEEGEKVS
jgi:hypothetical protein